MEEKGLKPSPEADRRTLARRAQLDLTGLPPDAGEVEAFVADKSPDAYEKFVDRLLASPAYGEHRARYWLDAARYGDTHGIHIDNYREIWPYRDWVIKAFNANQPFDQFTIEQLAGDLLPNRTLDQQVASGFNRCNITTSEGGAINEEYLVLYARDRTETVSQVFMGLTTGCAVCHDHKFDPISQKEFYELSAFFNNTTQAAMDGNVKDTPPIVFVPEPADRPRWDALVAELGGVKQAVRRPQAGRPPRVRQVARRLDPRAFAAMAPAEGQKLRATLGDRDSAAKKTAGRRARAGRPRRLREGPGLLLRALGQAARRPTSAGPSSSRMDEADDFRGWDLWLEGGKVAAHIIHKWPDDALKVVSDGDAEAERLEPRPGHLRRLGQGRRDQDLPRRQAPANQVDADALKDTIRTKVPFKLGQRTTRLKVEDADLP